MRSSSLALVDPELDHRVEAEPLVRQGPIQCFRLRHGTGKSVEDETFGGVRLPDAVGDDRNHDVVGDQLATRHDVLGLLADRAARLHGGAQHVAGGELHDPVFIDQALRLRAFAGPRRAEQYQPHRVSPRNSIVDQARPSGPSRVSVSASGPAASPV